MGNDGIIAFAFLVLAVCILVGIPASFYIGSSDCVIEGKITNLKMEKEDLYLTINNETYKFITFDSDIIYNHACEIHCTHLVFYDDCYIGNRIIYK